MKLVATLLFLAPCCAAGCQSARNGRLTADDPSLNDGWEQPEPEHPDLDPYAAPTFDPVSYVVADVTGHLVADVLLRALFRCH